MHRNTLKEVANIPHNYAHNNQNFGHSPASGLSFFFFLSLSLRGSHGIRQILMYIVFMAKQTPIFVLGAPHD